MKFYNKNWFMWVMLFTITPVGIIIMWKSGKFTKPVRAVLTGVFGLVFLVVTTGSISDGESQAAKQDKSIAVDNLIEEQSKASHDKSEVKVENHEQAPKTITNNENNKSGELIVHFIDVGQADSILIQQGTSAMLIDAGNNDDSNKVKSYIDSKGITKLDFVIGTHPHEDHIGGLDYIINSFKVGKVYMPKVTSNTNTFKDVISAIKNKNMQITTATPGTRFDLGQASCTILAPNSESYEDLNNFSIVIKVKFGNNIFMFTGDAGAISEMEMVNKGYDLKADVLKLGHHGSNTSSCANFLKDVNPKFAVISVGKDNSYGHPHSGTMDRLKGMNIPVYRTDEGGTIICTSDGNNIKFNANQGDYLSRGERGSEGTSNTKATSKKIAPVITNTSQGQSSEMVYIVGKGKKYHNPDCFYLDNKGKGLTLKDAVNQGYTPCKRCSPPTLN